MERTEEAIEGIRGRYKAAEAEFFRIGKALISLNRPEVLALYGETRFTDFVNNQVMSYSTAARFIAVAKVYEDEALVVRLSIERAYQLQRLARLDPKIKRSAEQLAKTNARLGSKKKRVFDMTAEEIGALADAFDRNAQRKKKPKPTAKEKASVKQARTELLEALGVKSAEVRIDAKKREVRVTLSLDEIVAGYKG